MNLFKSVVVFICFALAGCAVEPNGQSIRPGIGSEVDLDALRPPSGVTYHYVISGDIIPVPVAMSLTSRRLSAQKYSYKGQMVMTLPDAENLEDIADLLSKTMGTTSLRAKGNKLYIPIGLKSDNRFRSTQSNITGDRTRYVPNDCFGVLGTCRYKAVDRKGRAVHLVAKTTEAGGIWRSKTVLDPKIKSKGIAPQTRYSMYSMDKNAVLIDMILVRSKGAKRSDFAIRRK